MGEDVVGRVFEGGYGEKGRKRGMEDKEELFIYLRGNCIEIEKYFVSFFRFCVYLVYR